MRTIYALSDPRTLWVRYVGVTSAGDRAVESRITQHVAEARSDSAGSTAKSAWLRDLLVQGLRPVGTVLEVIGGGVAEASFAERKWIAALLAAGAALVNATSGGLGEARAPVAVVSDRSGTIERLRSARMAKGLSARRLSLLAGLTPSHVATIEARTGSSPEARTLAAIAKVLGVSVDWLVTGAGDEVLAKLAGLAS